MRSHVPITAFMLCSTSRIVVPRARIVLTSAMTRPKLLLLDEPSMGLSPIMTAEIGKIIRQINAMNVSIVLVEQNAMLALTLAGYGYVLETGLVVMQGRADELLRDEGVRKAYLGI